MSDEWCPRTFGWQQGSLPGPWTAPSSKVYYMSEKSCLNLGLLYGYCSSNHGIRYYQISYKSGCINGIYMYLLHIYFIRWLLIMPCGLMNKLSLFFAIILKICTPRRYKQIQKCFIFFIHFTRAQGILSNYLIL